MINEKIKYKKEKKKEQTKINVKGNIKNQNKFLIHGNHNQRGQLKKEPLF